uniref:amidase family protein n=1 Tax=Sphingomonas segetis TaxID=1104779 RepID=UPI0023B2F083
MGKWIAGAAALVLATAASAQLAGPAEVNVRAALDRIAAVDPQLHSVIALDPAAIEQALAVDSGTLRGPLAGQPVLIKDNIESAGTLPTTAGSLALAGNVTNRDAPLVARLR